MSDINQRFYELMGLLSNDVRNYLGDVYRGGYRDGEVSKQELIAELVELLEDTRHLLWRLKASEKLIKSLVQRFDDVINKHKGE